MKNIIAILFLILAISINGAAQNQLQYNQFTTNLNNNASLNNLVVSNTITDSTGSLGAGGYFLGNLGSGSGEAIAWSRNASGFTNLTAASLVGDISTNNITNAVAQLGLSSGGGVTNNYYFTNGGAISPGVYYLSSGGSDTNTGTSISTPWLTITNAQSKIPPFSTLHVEAGYYTMPAIGAYATNAGAAQGYYIWPVGTTIIGTAPGIIVQTNTSASPSQSAKTTYCQVTNTTFEVNGSNSFRFSDNCTFKDICIYQPYLGQFPVGVGNGISGTNILFYHCNIWGAYQQAFVSDGSQYGWTNALPESITFDSCTLTADGHGAYINTTNTQDVFRFVNSTIESHGGGGSPVTARAIDIEGSGQTIYISGGILKGIANNGSGSIVSALYVQGTNDIISVAPYDVQLGANLSLSYYEAYLSSGAISNSITIRNFSINANSITNMGTGNAIHYINAGMAYTNYP